MSARAGEVIFSNLRDPRGMRWRSISRPGDASLLGAALARRRINEPRKLRLRETALNPTNAL